MKDSFGRKIEYLRLSITDRCNLRCRYCMPAEGVEPIEHGEVLTYEEMLRIASVATRLGVKKIRITGGEPLVRRGIVDFIRELAALPTGPEITMTTNGVLLADMAFDLRKAGLSRVNVSLDSLREDRFQLITRRPGLQKVLDGIEAADAVGLTHLKINMVPLKGINHDEIVDFGRLALEHPWEIRFIEFMPVSSGLDFTPEHMFPAKSILEELGKIGKLVPLLRQGPAGPARLFHFPDSPGRVGVIPAISDHFCGECNRMRITADGRIRPCLFSSEEIDLREALRSSSSDEEIERLLREAACIKPQRHHIGEKEFRQGGRRMHGIGG
ncbi:MAG: GTP 3',8-cyclase MoaA [Syntrophotaleaceae bacterium]